MGCRLRQVPKRAVSENGVCLPLVSSARSASGKESSSPGKVQAVAMSRARRKKSRCRSQKSLWQSRKAEKATEKLSTAGQRPKSGRVKRNIVVCMGWDLAKSHRSRQNAKRWQCNVRRWQRASRVLSKVAGCFGDGVLAAMFGAAQPRVKPDPPVGGR